MIYTGTSASFTGSPNTIWTTWTSATTSDAITVQNAVWNQWVTSSSTYITSNAVIWQQWIVVDEASQILKIAPRIEIVETEAERQARRIQHEQYLRRHESDRAERKIADTRAERLLLENISPPQRRSLKENGYFDVHIKGKTYRIRRGTHGNVRLVQGDREVRSFCIQPPDVPAADAMLAQKLLLETDEESFLRIANARELH